MDLPNDVWAIIIKYILRKCICDRKELRIFERTCGKYNRELDLFFICKIAAVCKLFNKIYKAQLKLFTVSSFSVFHSYYHLIEIQIYYEIRHYDKLQLEKQNIRAKWIKIFDDRCRSNEITHASRTARKRLCVTFLHNAKKNYSEYPIIELLKLKKKEYSNPWRYYTPLDIFNRLRKYIYKHNLDKIILSTRHSQMIKHFEEEYIDSFIRNFII